MLVTTVRTPVGPRIFRQLLSTHVLVSRQSSNELEEFDIQLTSVRYYKDNVRFGRMIDAPGSSLSKNRQVVSTRRSSRRHKCGVTCKFTSVSNNQCSAPSSCRTGHGQTCSRVHHIYRRPRPRLDRDLRLSPPVSFSKGGF